MNIVEWLIYCATQDLFADNERWTFALLASEDPMWLGRSLCEVTGYGWSRR